MKILTSVILFLVFSVSFCNAYELKPNQWNDFEGSVGKASILLSLFRFDNGEIKGNYYYKKYETKIYVIGKIVNNKIELTELLDGKPNGTFNGTIFTDNKDRFEGTWVNNSSKQPVIFKLSLSSIVGGSYEHRYFSDLGTDTALEFFMKQLKNSILKGDKNWVASHTYYPINVHLNKNRLTSIKNKEQLIKHFDQIFNQEYKKQISTVRTYNLFINQDGVMLGRGNIWINPTLTSTREKPEYRVTAINS